MTRKDAKLKIKVLLSNYKDHNLTETEIDTIATTISTLVYSEKSTRIMWYAGMEKVAEQITNFLHEQGEKIIAALNLTKEEEDELRQKVKAKRKEKVEN